MLKPIFDFIKSYVVPDKKLSAAELEFLDGVFGRL